MLGIYAVQEGIFGPWVHFFKISPTRIHQVGPIQNQNMGKSVNSIPKKRGWAFIRQWDVETLWDLYK